MSRLRIVILAVLLVITFRASFSLIARAPAPTAVAFPAPTRQPSEAAVTSEAPGSGGDEGVVPDRTTSAAPLVGRKQDFRARFPGTPEVDDLPANEFIQTAQQFAVESDGRAYKVIRMELSPDLSRTPAKAELFMVGMVQGLTKVGPVERSIPEVAAHGYRMREFFLTNSFGEHLRTRIYLAGGRVFVVGLAALERSRLSDATADLFFASFVII